MGELDGGKVLKRGMQVQWTSPLTVSNKDISTHTLTRIVEWNVLPETISSGGSEWAVPFIISM